mmetsp:Transcript_11521/g.35568  ORF Transcript_11521/g.35568 Transcript_11521/m.35568 type:complete len:442 (-) Transcript_11521:100-1425(-)|eukprot:scaffold198365_cov41-Tisochrysis_lutea.AAC.1
MLWLAHKLSLCRTPHNRKRSLTLKVWLLHVVVLVAYLFAGALAYHFLEPEWSFFTATYFSFMLTSTVGYGCISPTSQESRSFTVGYTLLSVPIITASLSAIMEPFVEYPYILLKENFIRRLPFFRTDHDDPVNPPGSLHFYLRGMIPVILYNNFMLIILVSWFALAANMRPGSMSNSLAEPDEDRLNYFDAIYFTMITSTTIGLGDICPIMDVSRGVAMMVSCIGMSMIGLYINTYNDLQEERRMQSRRAQVLRIESLGAELFDYFDISKDGLVDRTEWLIGMLTVLEYIRPVDLRPILERFDDLDADGSGTLTRTEVQGLLEMRAKEVRIGRIAQKFRSNIVAPASSEEILVAKAKSTMRRWMSISSLQTQQQSPSAKAQRSRDEATRRRLEMLRKSSTSRTSSEGPRPSGNMHQNDNKPKPAWQRNYSKPQLYRHHEDG